MIVVQHRSDTVKTEAVKMVFLQPELQIGKQEVQNTGLAVIKALGSPGRMLTLFSIVEELPYRSIKHMDTFRCVLNRMGMDQIQQDTDAHIMGFIHKIFQILRMTEPGTGRKEVGHLVAKASVIRMMSSVTAIINAITYVLIAFVAVSLVVSSIMIGVITLISVQERTKEIGILRAMGASKRDISRVFNAETLIIGLAAGIIGIVFTVLICIPVSAIIQHVTGIPSIAAVLPWIGGVALIVISTVLTMISGLIPSRSASRKDPVVALRTE